jgi:hypothetical protein
MMKALKANAISKTVFDKLSPEEKGENNKIVRGVLHRRDRPEYSQIYSSLVERVHDETLETLNAGGNYGKAR